MSVTDLAKRLYQTATPMLELIKMVFATAVEPINSKMVQSIRAVIKTVLETAKEQCIIQISPNTKAFIA